MGSTPQISVVIPCYRGAAFLPQAIESCLRQTLADHEVIVVDDASPDECAEIAERYAATDQRVRLVRRPANGGVSEAFNSGFRVARGKYLTRLAQDDVFCDNALQVFVNFLDTRKEVGLLYCDFKRIDAKGALIGTASVPRAHAALLYGNRLGLCVAWRREVWEQIGGFRKELDTSEDYDYWLRVWEQFNIEKCEGVAPLMVRTHDKMGSLQFAARQAETTLRILRDFYPRRFGPVKRAVMRRIAIARTYSSASADYPLLGRRWQAIGSMMRSLATWPLPYWNKDLENSFRRFKLLAALLVPSLVRRNRDMGRGASA